MLEGMRERGKLIIGDDVPLVRAQGLEPTLVLLESSDGAAAD
jgi:hypothetical protein